MVIATVVGTGVGAGDGTAESEGAGVGWKVSEGALVEGAAVGRKVAEGAGVGEAVLHLNARNESTLVLGRLDHAPIELKWEADSPSELGVGGSVKVAAQVAAQDFALEAAGEEPVSLSSLVQRIADLEAAVSRRRLDGQDA